MNEGTMPEAWSQAQWVPMTRAPGLERAEAVHLGSFTDAEGRHVDLWLQYAAVFRRVCVGAETSWSVLPRDRRA